MTDFIARSAEFNGRFVLAGPIEAVFDLFSPLGERLWVPEWNPELLFPSGVSWACGQIFRTREEAGEAVWVVTTLTRESHEVEYHRVEPSRYVARVRVKCTAQAHQATEVSTSYSFIGLTAEGNDAIGAMTDASYAEKMKRWERWISQYLTRQATTMEG
jgi:hypothetical protein